MKELAASLVLFFIISIHPDFCAGLECKTGTSHRGPDYTYNSFRNSTCFADEIYCAAGTCTKAGVGAFSRIWWLCAPVYHVPDCARNAKNEAMKVVNVTNFDCKCDYGAKGEDFSNAKFELLPVPISNVLTCKKGDLDLEEYGGAYKEKCSHDEDQYCYMASCAKGNKHVMSVWNCSPDTNCTAISAKVGKTVNATVTCECLFGKANASLANENFTLPMVPTMNADKPKTTTDKPTTTTGKPTTTTGKPTTTSEKTMTPTTNNPTTTTAEANLGVRAKISVCSGVLIVIGHVLASILPKLGVGQLFNDL